MLYKIQFILYGTLQNIKSSNIINVGKMIENCQLKQKNVDKKFRSAIEVIKLDCFEYRK